MLNLDTGIHKPFTKSNNTILYVDANSNHPPSIQKDIPLSVQKRLSILSSNEQVFNEIVLQYQEALDKAGYKHKLIYESQANIHKQKRNRSKQITWINPPFSQNVVTNVGAEILKAIKSSFPKDHPLYKIFNRNTIKISYRTMSSMQQVISRHNTKILNKNIKVKPKKKPDCNCQKANLPCIAGGKCVPGNVVYQGNVTRLDTGHVDTYTGLSEPSFKLRWGNHKASLTHESQRTDTCLSSHIWDLKDEKIPYTLEFKQLTQAPGYNPITNQCRLCLSEKYFIMFKPEGATINSRSEFFSSCRHKKGLLLCPPPPKPKKVKP